ncbi:MAG: carbohydrate kinase family protein, partial [Patescibacteria group bacterium]
NHPVKDWKEAPSGKAIVYNLGEKYGVKDYYGTIGGNSANASVTFARQGFKTACLAKIGKDLVGGQFEARLKKEGVKRSLLAKTSEKPTAYSALLLTESGERTILSYHGASDTFTFQDAPLKKLKAKWWYLSLAGESHKMFYALLDFAKENKIKVGFNPSGFHLFHGREGILTRLKDITFLVLNEEEAAELTGIPFQKESEVFKKLDNLMPGIVAVTNGPKGVTVSDGKNIYKAGIFKEKQIADRTGAGDAFGSGFVAGLMIRSKLQVKNQNLFDSEDIKYAIRLATANATSVVERVGATEGILTKEQFENDTRGKDLEIQVKSS